MRAFLLLQKQPTSQTAIAGHKTRSGFDRGWINQLKKDVIRLSGEPTPEMKEQTHELERTARREIKGKRRALPDVRVEAVPVRTEYNAPPADMPTQWISTLSNICPNNIKRRADSPNMN